MYLSKVPNNSGVSINPICQQHLRTHPLPQPTLLHHLAWFKFNGNICIPSTLSRHYIRFSVYIYTYTENESGFCQLSLIRPEFIRRQTNPSEKITRVSSDDIMFNVKQKDFVVQKVPVHPEIEYLGGQNFLTKVFFPSLQRRCSSGGYDQ